MAVAARASRPGASCGRWLTLSDTQTSLRWPPCSHPPANGSLLIKGNGKRTSPPPGTTHRQWNFQEAEESDQNRNSAREPTRGACPLGVGTTRTGAFRLEGHEGDEPGHSLEADAPRTSSRAPGPPLSEVRDPRAMSSHPGVVRVPGPGLRHHRLLP